jgi:hypothetical protein
MPDVIHPVKTAGHDRVGVDSRKKIFSAIQFQNGDVILTVMVCLYLFSL